MSPRLKIRFDLFHPEMLVVGPDGRPFLTFEELEAARLLAEQQTDEARKQTDVARKQAEEARRTARRLAELGRKARLGQADPTELEELERLENEAAS